MVQATLADFGLVGWPKTSGSRGIHVYVRIEPRWTFPEVRRAALAFAREVERRAPALATSKWWKEERHGVFLDYNQNAKDRTIAGAYSVRPRPDARVSAPLAWDEVEDCEPESFTITTMPARFRQLGDLHAGIDRAHCSIETLLELSARHEKMASGMLHGRPNMRSSRESRRVCNPLENAPRSIQLIEIGRAEKKDDALAGLERWRTRHPRAAAHLEPADILVDAMRGRSSTWTRIRVNLEHVPEDLRPVQEALDPDAGPKHWGADDSKWAGARSRAAASKSAGNKPVRRPAKPE